MARRPRHSSPGATYHVMVRGNNGQSIFASDDERCQFCLLMQEGVERYGHRILAFCFMTNHVHLAIQLGNVSLSKICQNLAFRYTRFYNWKHKTIGHLFQGRFRSILVDGNSYLRKLIRYIHLNPVRAKLTDDPLCFSWSSHQAYLMQKEYTWLARDSGLQLFGESLQEALDRYFCFITSGIGQAEEVDFKRGITAGVVAEDAFIENMSKRHDEETITNEQIKIDIKTLLSVIANWYNINVEAFPNLGNDRRASLIRSVAAHLARYIGGITLKEIAIVFDRADNSMSQAATRLEAQMCKSSQLKNEIDDLKAKLSLVGKELGKSRKLEV